ncbi:MAG TPA: phosphotransferase [Micrococcaceae bacterium]
MSWHPPVPSVGYDDAGHPWQVRRAWPSLSAGDYTLELGLPGRRGVRAAFYRQGQIEMLAPADDARLPALADASLHGEVLVHRAGKRAVVQSDGQFIKIFRRSLLNDAAERHSLMAGILSGGDFVTPTLLSRSSGSLTFTSVPGRSLFELGQDPTLTDQQFERLWKKWSRGWVDQYSEQLVPLRTGLPSHSSAVELESLRRIADLWLLHSAEVPAAAAQRLVLRAQLDQVGGLLLSGTPDRTVWSHGDLHDKQILVVDADAPLGLIDFDEASEAEVAQDLANLAVHLELRLRQKRLSRQRFLAARRQVVAAALELQVSPARFHAYSEATRLRLGCLYAFRPSWAALAQGLIGTPL